jgi:transcriptional regulator with PAS, ATPase and Fis domain
MPQSTQPKLLRVLEDLRVRRLGGKHEIAVDARILAATSQEIGSHLREELYYRLSVFQIVIPPLRERKEDIPLIAEVMLQNLNKKHGTRVTGVDAEVLGLLYRYDWPGNVRELRNVLERAAIMAGEGLIRLTNLGGPRSVQVPARIGGHPAMRALECSSRPIADANRGDLHQAHARSRGRQSQARR